MCEQKAKGDSHLAVRKRWPPSSIFNEVEVSNIELIIIIIKVKVKFTLEQATKTQKGSRGITLLFP